MKPQELILTISVVIGFTTFLTLRSKRQRDSSWEGTLESKKIHEDPETDKTTYTLTFRTDQGRKVKINVDQKTYDSYDQGAKVSKKSGTYIPEIVN